MGRPKGSKNKTESDKKGKERIKRFEERSDNDVEVVKSPIIENNLEEETITCFQKRGDNEWEKIEIPFKRKKL